MTPKERLLEKVHQILSHKNHQMTMQLIFIVLKSTSPNFEVEIFNESGNVPTRMGLGAYR